MRIKDAEKRKKLKNRIIALDLIYKEIIKMEEELDGKDHDDFIKIVSSLTNIVAELENLVGIDEKDYKYL